MSSNKDGKYFQKGKIQELRAQLIGPGDSKQHKNKKIALKKIIANITMGLDMSPLFLDVIACWISNRWKSKKCYAKMFLSTEATFIKSFSKDLSDPNPLLRALAFRTLSYINNEKILEILIDPLQLALKDKDPYVCKTAALCVAKLHSYNPEKIENLGLHYSLFDLLKHGNTMVISNAMTALIEIAANSENFFLVIDLSTAHSLIVALDETSEWGQVYIMEGLMYFVPEESSDAEMIVERILPRLQHVNSAIALTSIKVIMYLTNYIASDSKVEILYNKLGTPLVTLLHNTQEIQYIALRNILLILHKYPGFLRKELKVFFVKFSDPMYVKLTKLDIIYKRTDRDNISQVLPELKEYASEIDVDFVRRSVRSIGRCAIKIEGSADKCMEVLVQLVETRVNYVVQEAVIVIKDIFRKYPNRFESIISSLCSSLSSLDESEAKASMIWIIGHYADRIDNADELLESFMEGIKEDTHQVQLSLLTSVVKLFIKRPNAGKDLLNRILKWTTEESGNPDLRERGFIYWRLLSTDPVAAKAIVLGDKPTITTESDMLDEPILEELLLHIATLSSIYHKPGRKIFGNFKARGLIQTPALVTGRKRDFLLSESNPLYSKDALKDLANLENAYDFSTGFEINNDLNTPYSNSGFDQFDDLSEEPGSQPPNNNEYNSLDPFGKDLDIFGSTDNQGNSSGYKNNIDYNDTSRISETNPFHGGYASLSDTTPVPTQLPISADLVSGPYNPFSKFATTSAVVSNYPVPASYLPVQHSAFPVSSDHDLTIDPFARNTADPLVSSMNEMVIDERMELFLDSVSGKGLEVSGKFERRNKKIYLDLSLVNYGNTPVGDFALLLNRNSMGLTPEEESLDSTNFILPSQRTTLAVPLICRASNVVFNNENPTGIQIALRSSFGILIFEASFPLFVFFSEQGRLLPDDWISTWKDIPDYNSTSCLIADLVYSDDTVISRLLESKSVFTVAVRTIDNERILYTSIRLEDGTVFVSELRFDLSLSRCQVTSKSHMITLGVAVNKMIEEMLK